MAAGYTAAGYTAGGYTAGGVGALHANGLLEGTYAGGKRDRAGLSARSSRHESPRANRTALQTNRSAAMMARRGERKEEMYGRGGRASDEPWGATRSRGSVICTLSGRTFGVGEALQEGVRRLERIVLPKDPAVHVCVVILHFTNCA